MKVFIILGLIGMVAASGYGPRPACKKELVTLTLKACRLEAGEKECTSETKVVGDKITYDKECKEIEVCKPVHFIPRVAGHYGGGYGKRSAEAEASYTECEKETKEICKRVPVKTPVEKEVETCSQTPVEVCEDVERQVAKLVCSEVKH